MCCGIGLVAIRAHPYIPCMFAARAGMKVVGSLVSFAFAGAGRSRSHRPPTVAARGQSRPRATRRSPGTAGGTRRPERAAARLSRRRRTSRAPRSRRRRRRRVPTRAPFSCAPLPEAFIFPPPASRRARPLQPVRQLFGRAGHRGGDEPGRAPRGAGDRRRHRAGGRGRLAAGGRGAGVAARDDRRRRVLARRSDHPHARERPARGDALARGRRDGRDAGLDTDACPAISTIGGSAAGSRSRPMGAPRWRRPGRACSCSTSRPATVRASALRGRRGPGRRLRSRRQPRRRGGGRRRPRHCTHIAERRRGGAARRRPGQPCATLADLGSYPGWHGLPAFRASPTEDLVLVASGRWTTRPACARSG